MKKSLIFLMLTGALIMSCNKPKECLDGKKAVIRDYSSLDDCRWIIEIEKDNSHWQPLNLDSFSVVPSDGKKIWVDFEVAPQANTCMHGETVKIRCIEER